MVITLCYTLLLFSATMCLLNPNVFRFIPQRLLRAFLHFTPFKPVFITVGKLLPQLEEILGLIITRIYTSLIFFKIKAMIFLFKLIKVALVFNAINGASANNILRDMIDQPVKLLRTCDHLQRNLFLTR